MAPDRTSAIAWIGFAADLRYVSWPGSPTEATSRPPASTTAMWPNLSPSTMSPRRRTSTVARTGPRYLATMNFPTCPSRPGESTWNT